MEKDVAPEAAVLLLSLSLATTAVPTIPTGDAMVTAAIELYMPTIARRLDVVAVLVVAAAR